jgi:hypothetical protein
VLAVTKVTNPCLQRWGVVLLDNSAVGLDGSVTRDGCPLAGIGDEANVDGCMLLEVIGLARLCVGVKEEVEAVSFLLFVSPPGTGRN